MLYRLEPAKTDMNIDTFIYWTLQNILENKLTGAASELYDGGLGARRGAEAGPGGACVAAAPRRAHRAREGGAGHRVAVEPDG